ncbi:MAG TPA: hypothetical protein VJU77_17700 [Chthoniobacterales bacterium]|nr:hypothetical protein [Chthoniobacterales bacterium]
MTRSLCRFGLAPWALLLLAIAKPAFAQQYGLDSRAAIGPYLNNIMPPAEGDFPFPQMLSATGAFSDPATLTPAPGLIPYTVNSSLWSDGAVKTRWIAVPNDGPPYAASEQISFAPTGEWTFPNGTVFVKHFELTVNEMTGERRRIETRLLVRDGTGEVYGVTYRWEPGNTSDAQLVAPPGLDEDITITGANGATRVQTWHYPSHGECQVCHNTPAKYVLGVKTHQINKDFTYPSTGRTDNQLRTFLHLGMLNPAPSESEIPTFLKSVAVTDQTATVQHRMRSWIDANCSQCHRPGGFGGGYDARLATPLPDQNLIDNLVFFRDLASSDLYQRDNSLGEEKMPPIAKNVVDENAMANLRQWIASPFEIISVNLYQDASHLIVRFNSHVDPTSAVVPANYTLDQGLVVSAAAVGPDPDTVILTVPSLNQSQTYLLTVSDVTDTAPSANTIWPQSQKSFAAQFEQLPTTARLANISTRLQVGTGDEVLIAGFIMRGSSPKRVLVRADGPSLGAYGIANPLADPILELHDSAGALIATNDSWSDNYNRQEISDTGIAPSSQKEAVILATLPSSAAGTAYTAVVRGVDNGIGTAVVEVYDLDRTDSSKLLNISTRGLVQIGDNVLIAGTIISGPAPQKVLVRAIGPSLPIPTRLEDPALELRNANGGLVASNDNWRTDQEADILATQLQPSNDLESAILATLPANNAGYTAVVRGAGGFTGIAVVEVYALAP